MKPATQDEFDHYVGTPEGYAYVTSDDFAQRVVDLYKRFEAGEQMTVADAADVLGLPVNVFRHLFGSYLAMLHMMMGAAPTTETKH